MAGPHIDGRILIAGAGIGGLSAGIALAREGISSQIVERSRVFSTDGAGIQLGPNATRVLEQWGVLDALSQSAVQPDQINLFDARTGARLAEVPFGALAQERYGSPYITVHRADLQRALLECARSHDAIALRRHFEIENIEASGASVALQASDGAKAQGGLLIGADGIWSRVRAEIHPRSKLRFTGKTAWRALLQKSSVPQMFLDNVIGLWMSPSAHLVHYPVNGGEALNIVAVIKDRTAGQGWNIEGNSNDLEPHFRSWPREIRELFSIIPAWRKWSLVAMSRLDSWSQGNITLLGDAAHPILPFMAQGGAMAIEDAQALASALAHGTGSVDQSLNEYQIARISRTQRVQAASRRMGRIYHMGGLAASARNLVLRACRPVSLIGGYDWLYGFRAAD